ncbi:MAG: 16S rRNA (guanine(527)-N(7))-methyltransferase RsmG [Clostridiales bacterium]|nr:16S rRNA (guanine(527)-N(7))-methyltransferase RsmG [Clostridiales bacterium]
MPKERDSKAMSAFRIYMQQALAENGLEDYLAHIEAFAILAGLLQEQNKKMNITAITDDEGIARKHIADSLVAAAELAPGANVADVGCGGGFPTLPLAIARKDIAITAIDSTAKKLAFVAEAATRLKLPHITVLPARAETIARGPLRGSFDAVTARAVAALPVLLELCVPLLRTGGKLIALKGKNGAEELAASGAALEKLGCTAVIKEYTLFSPEPQGRSLVIVTKKGTTPAEYPRDYAKIIKKPL